MSQNLQVFSVTAFQIRVISDCAADIVVTPDLATHWFQKEGSSSTLLLPQKHPPSPKQTEYDQP